MKIMANLHCGFKKLLIIVSILIGFIFISFSKSNFNKFNEDIRYFNSEKNFSSKYNPLLRELGIYDDVEFDYDNVKNFHIIDHVTFVTAFSENHAGEGRRLIIDFAKVYPDKKFIVYDIGLSPVTRKWFQKSCNAEVRDINLKRYIGRASLSTYRFKPIIIATALKEFPVVVWLDSSIVPVKSLATLDEHLTIVPDQPNIYLFDYVDHSIFATTNPEMFKYLKPRSDDLKYGKCFQAGLALYIRTKATYRLGLKWYVLCALEKDCMDAPGSQLSCSFRDPIRDYARCHRYDQSALSTIISEYNYTNPEVKHLYFQVRRGVTRGANEYPKCN